MLRLLTADGAHQEALGYPPVWRVERLWRSTRRDLQLAVQTWACGPAPTIQGANKSFCICCASDCS
jgi:hypothetical protein